jgi:hypothetical protein
MAKAEELSRMSSALIAKLQIGINRERISFYNKNLEQIQELVSKTTSECNIYIDTLLYYIHSKATLEIDSFTRDNVIAEHGKFIDKFVNDKYKELLNWGSRGDDFLTYMVFEHPDEAVYFLELAEDAATPESYKLKLIKESKQERVFDNFLQTYQQVISVKYQEFSALYTNLLIELRNLLYKTKSINHLIDRLRSGEVEWDESGDHTQTIADEIITISTPGKFRLG